MRKGWAHRWGIAAAVIAIGVSRSGDGPGLAVLGSMERTASARSAGNGAAPYAESAVFGLSKAYDSGAEPAVALDPSGIVLEAHRSDDGARLVHRVGVLRELDVAWGRATVYDAGSSPALAVDAEGTVVEVHRAEATADLVYRVGKLHRPTRSLELGPGVAYDRGASPRIALTPGGHVVEVHRADHDGTLSARVGRVDVPARAITWGEGIVFGTGSTPTVAAMPDGTLVEAHASAGGTLLSARVGHVDGDALRVTFGEGAAYGRGTAPSLAVDGAGHVVETHVSESGAPALFRTMGALAPGGGALTWGPSERFDSGVAPHVAAAGDTAVLVHGSANGRSLGVSASFVTDRARWMGATKALHDRPLRSITLPGTHDSGAYALTTELAACRDIGLPGFLQRPFAETQERDFLGQLQGGARYFDLRPAYYPKTGDIHAYHALIGPRIASIVDQVATFLSAVDRELVVLNVSHFCGFDDALHERLVGTFRSRLGPYLTTVSAEELRSVPFGELVRGGPRVVVLYDDVYLARRPAPGFFPSRALDVYDRYANTDRLEVMRADQDAKWRAQPKDARGLFLLSWTLTFRGNVFDGDLHTLTKKASRELGGYLAQAEGLPRPNVLYVDFFEDSRVVDLAIALNRRP